MVICKLVRFPVVRYTVRDGKGNGKGRVAVYRKLQNAEQWQMYRRGTKVIGRWCRQGYGNSKHALAQSRTSTFREQSGPMEPLK